MDRKVFEEKYKNAFEEVNTQYMKNVVNRSIDNSSIEVKGCKNLVIAMEELAELSQEISKIIRGKGDKMGLLEEYADVLVVLEWIKKIANLKDEEIARALNVKLNKIYAYHTELENSTQ